MMEISKEQMEELRKELSLKQISEKISKNPKYALEYFECIVGGLIDFKQDLDKQQSNIWIIVKNLKPEHLEEMKKLIVPEVFTSLGIEV